MKGYTRASTYAMRYVVFCALTLLGIRPILCRMRAVQMIRSTVSFNNPTLLQCAFESLVGGFAGIQVDDTTGQCGSLTVSDYRNGAHSTRYYIQTAFHRTYSEPPSTLYEYIPVTVNVGARFEFHIQQRNRFRLNLMNSNTSNRMFHLNCLPPQLILNNMYSGVFENGDWLDVDLSEDRTYVINAKVTTAGFEIHIDDVYIYMYAHRQNISDIDTIFFTYEGDPQSTISELTWYVPP